LNGSVEMAFGSDIAPGKYLTTEQQSQLKLVETLGLVPSHVFVVSNNLSDKTKQHLVDSMVKLNHQDNNQILKDIYGADALLPTTAEMHIGNFGQYLDLLPGFEYATLDKKNYDLPKLLTDMHEQIGSPSSSISTLSFVQMNDVSASYDSKNYVLIKSKCQSLEEQIMQSLDNPVLVNPPY